MDWNGHNNDDDDDRDDRGSSHNRYGSSHSSSSSSSSSDRMTFDKTSAFSTMIGEDGRFFGIQLDKTLADRAKNLFPVFLYYLSDKAGDWARAKHGPAAGNALGLGIALSEQIFNTGQNLYDSTKSLNDLRIAVHPLSKVGSDVRNTSALSGTNEVVSNARGKISGIFWQRMVETGVSTIGTMPTLLMNIKKAHATNHERDLQHRFAAAKGKPEQLASILEEEIALGAKSVKGIDLNDMRAASESIVEKHRVAYEAKFKEFKTANERELQKDIETIFDDLKKHPDYASGHLAKLSRLGVKTEGLEQDIKYIKSRRNGNVNDRNEEISAAVKKFTQYRDPKRKKSYSFNQKSPYLEDALATKFVRQNGAFDAEWLEYLPNDERNQMRGTRDNPGTEKERIEQKIHKLGELQENAEKEKTKDKGHEDNISTMINVGWNLAAGVGREVFTKLIGGKALEQYEKPIALDRILHLRRELEKAKDEPPELVPGIRIGKDKNDNDVGYARYVHDIFQQHQKDCSRPDIGDRFFEHFEKAHWSDEEIQKLSDDELTPYELAVKNIAKRIKDGRMDAIALVELVGDKTKKIVSDDGRSFGPKGASKEDAPLKEAIKAIIDEKTAMISAGQEQTEEQINDKLGNFVFGVEDMKKALESNDLDKQERAFLFTLFSNVVGTDDKLCQKLGIKAERCQELRKESKETFNPMLDGAVIVLADMIEHHSEVMEKNLKLTDKEKELIKHLAEKAKEEHKNVADLTENREEIKSLETVVANATLTLAKQPGEAGEDGKPKKFWQRLVTAAREQKEAIKNHAANKDKDKDKDKESAHDKEEGDEDRSFKSKKSKNAKHKHDDMDMDDHEASHDEDKKNSKDKKSWSDDDHVKPRKKSWEADADEGYAARERTKAKDFETRMAP